MDHALAVLRSYNGCDYQRFFELYRCAPAMGAYLMDFLVDRARRNAWRRILKAYSASSSSSSAAAAASAASAASASESSSADDGSGRKKKRKKKTTTTKAQKETAPEQPQPKPQRFPQLNGPVPAVGYLRLSFLEGALAFDGDRDGCLSFVESLGGVVVVAEAAAPIGGGDDGDYDGKEGAMLVLDVLQSRLAHQQQ